MAPKPIPIDKETVLSVAREVAATEEQPSRTKLANRLGMVASTLNKKAATEGWLEEIDATLHPPVQVRPAIEKPGVTHNDDGSASLVSEAEIKSWTREGLLKAHGFDLDEWVVVRARANRWGDPAEPSEQLRIDVVPKGGVIDLPDPAKWTPPPKPKKQPKAKGPKKVVVVSDHHCPFEDRTLHGLFCQWLTDEQPDEGIINGDLLDFHTVSRHRNRDGFAAPVNECLQAAFNVLCDYRTASPDTRWTLKKGNHCQRIEDQVIDNIRGLHKIAVAGDDVPALSLRRLLRLDELHIEFIPEDWDMAKIRLSKKLSVRHGPSTGKAATQRLLDKFSVSVIQGHTHRLSTTYRTEHSDDDDEPTTTRMAAEGGCMCQIHQGLGYADSPDWNQGFIVAHVWDDGDFVTSPVPYVPGRLLTPDGRRYVG